MKYDALLEPATATLVVAPLIDDVVEAHGFGPQSGYVEYCWLPILGPTSTWLYRRLAMPLLTADRFEVDLVDLASSLGLGHGLGRSSPLMRSLQRLVVFHAADFRDTRLLVRRALPPVSMRQATQLSVSARDVHYRLTRGG